ncbi:HTTM domain-containing protein [Stigmatella aurantiaca]|uniref:HTTM domain-containing protein n=1 Tax=Stigmatella aurantiaca (strain DW4/3-1) TaxID=378806 RepID=Q08QJ1_STIAD|nr:HTTM domain-containing protein [Stigmatella aurantiaca]ADO73156.1 uncharacterized protein STAUR_5385 [Stigmatella aurantiaca DW4/3-1]EAU62752.1 hypothetical protein STIAU_7460 [Stigmatella aurantiaca DW4/3-1]
MLRKKIEGFLFDQPNLDFRIFVVRVAVSLVVVSYTLAGPFDHFHVDAAGLLYRPVGPFRFIPALGFWAFYILKYTVAVSGLTFALGYKTRLSNAVFALSYFVFAYYVGHFSTQLFSYITHLNLFAIILCFVDSARFWSLDWVLEPARREQPSSKAHREFASFSLAFMQLYVIAFYVQGGGSKLLIGGVDWFLSGQTPYFGTIVAGTNLGLELTRFRWLFPGISLFTGFFELCFFLILWKPLRLIYAVTTLCFHFGILLSMNIFFYQLSSMVPLLFLLDDTRNHRKALAGLGVYVLCIGGLMAMTPLNAHPLATTETPHQTLPTVQPTD